MRMGSSYFDAHSFWQRTPRPLFKSLTADLRVDTCVVGAGIAGLTVAFELLKAGQKVAIIERERIGLGETGLTSAHLSSALDEGYVNLQRMHGREGARLAAESHTQAIDYIERLQLENRIDCDFQRANGYLFLGPQQNVADLKAELEAARSSGLSSVRLEKKAPTQLFDTGPCLKYSDQAQFQPLRYLDGLAVLVDSLGGSIFTHTEAVEILGGRNAYVKTSHGYKIEADSIVVATNVPFNNLVAIHTKNSAYRSYIVGVLIPPERAGSALFWDTAHPYHFIRTVKDSATGEDILLVGGEDHRTGQDTNPEEHFINLEKWIRHRMDIDSRVVTRWSGQIMEPVDGLAYIGHNPGDEENVYVVTGDSGHGLTHGTIAGMILRDLILRKANPWQKLYDPSRLHFRSLGAYVKDIAQSTSPYTAWLSEGDVKSVQEIKNGEGAVIREGLRKTAVFKDEVGLVHTCSAVCTHLGGLVNWNSAEKTWDCPCHGSRYDRFGEVLNGPAIQALAPITGTAESETEASHFKFAHDGSAGSECNP